MKEKYLLQYSSILSFIKTSKMNNNNNNNKRRTSNEDDKRMKKKHAKKTHTHSYVNDEWNYEESIVTQKMSVPEEEEDDDDEEGKNKPTSTNKGEHMIRIVSVGKRNEDLEENFSDLSDEVGKKQNEKVDRLCNLEVGHTMRSNSALGRYELVVPKYSMNTRNSTKNKVFLHVQGEILDGMKGPYWSQLKDQRYIKDLHRSIVGRLEVWRMGVQKLCEELDLKGEVPKKTYVSQLEYVMRKVPVMQDGIDKFDIFPIPILNHCSLILMVKGVETTEDADLIRNISNYNEIKVRAMCNTNKKTAAIVTTFDNHPQIKMYGKRDNPKVKVITQYHF